MTEHAIVMTMPRNGPYTDLDPLVPVLRRLGFIPVPSKRTGNYSNWVTHHYSTHNLWELIMCVEYQEPIINSVGFAPRLCLVSDEGEAYFTPDTRTAAIGD